MPEKKVLKDDVSGLIVTKVHECHLERQNNDIVVVSDDKIVDYDAEIQSYRNQAGMQAIIKANTLKYGTLENAIFNLEKRKVYLDTSNLPDNVGDTAIYVKNARDKVEEYAAKLGMSVDDFLNLNESTFKVISESKKKGLNGDSNVKDE